MASKQFRCASVGYSECDWHLEGNSEAEMLSQIEDHALKVHHLQFKDEAIEHVKNAIQDLP